MPQKNNSASRIRALFQGIHKFKDNERTLVVWARILAVPQMPSDARTAIEIAKRLGWVQRELELVRVQMRNLAVLREELYKPGLDNIESALTPLELVGTWATIRAQLNPQTMHMLELCIDICPAQPSVKESALEEIRKLLVELESSLETSDLPEDLQSLLRKHIRIIREALDEFRIAGVSAFTDGLNQAMAEVWAAETDLQKNAQSPAVSVYIRTWKTLGNMVKMAAVGEKVVAIGRHVTDFLLERLP
jgi:hypothetical protein